MNRVTITLTIDLPDGVVPDVQYSSIEEPPYVAEFPPLGDAIVSAKEARPYDRDEIVSPNVQRDPAPLCQHGIPMKRWPAGVNKQGKPYNASWRPSDAGCATKALWDKDPVAA
jgi:hypothetical protein